MHACMHACIYVCMYVFMYACKAILNAYIAYIELHVHVDMEFNLIRCHFLQLKSSL